MLAETFTSALFQPWCNIVHRHLHGNVSSFQPRIAQAVQHTRLSSAWSVLQCWARSKASSPAGWLSTCPVCDGAGSRPCKMTTHSGILQPGTALRLLQYEKQANNWRKHDALPTFWASNLPKLYTTLGVKQNNSSVPYKRTLAVVSLQSPTSSSRHSPWPPLLHTLSTDGREPCYGIYNTDFKRLPEYRNWCIATYNFFAALQIA